MIGPLAPARRLARPRIAAVVVVVAAVAVAAVIVYQQTIPVTSYVPARLSQLVVTQPGFAGLDRSATTAKSVPASSDPFAAARSAAKAQPEATGGYVRAWSSPTSKYRFAEVLAVWLPTTATAGTTLTQAVSQYLDKSAYSSEGLLYQSASGPLPVPGAHRATYQAAATKTQPAISLDVTVLRHGRVVAVVDTIETSPTLARADNTTLARAEVARLAATGPGFSLRRTTRPPLATALFAAGAVAGAGLSGLAVVMLPRLRRRRRLRRAARARYEVRVKGQTVVKHHRTPLP